MSIFSSLPNTLTNGTTADATQVMANFNQIVNNGNANAAENGANSSITSLSGLTTPLSQAQGGTGTTSGAVFPSGTILICRSSATPTGWTKLTTNNDCALRVVSGTAGTGGSVAFSTAFSAANTVDGHALTTAELAVHSHANTLSDPGHAHSFAFTAASASGSAAGTPGGGSTFNTNSNTTGITISNANAGSGSAHSHTLSNLAVKYVDYYEIQKN